MIKSEKHWFDEDFGMSPYGENKILFTAQYLAFYKFPKVYKSKVIRLIETYRDRDGNWITKGEDNLSHDNRTAIVCLSKAYGLEYHKEFISKSLIHSMLHPRDFIFYAYASGGFLGVLGAILYPIALLAMVHSCWVSYKFRGGKKFIRTDGKLLTWLRCKSFNLKITSLLCTWIIQKGILFGSWKKCFEIYFKEASHPNRNMKDEWYNI